MTWWIDAGVGASPFSSQKAFSHQNMLLLLLPLPGLRVSQIPVYCSLRGKVKIRRQKQEALLPTGKKTLRFCQLLLFFLTLLFPPSVLWLLCSPEKTSFVYVERAALINESKQPLLCYSLDDALIFTVFQTWFLHCCTGRNLLNRSWERRDGFVDVIRLWWIGYTCLIPLCIMIKSRTPAD